MQNSEWMKNTPGFLSLPLGDAVLPQSHDCGSYAPNYGLVPNFGSKYNDLIQVLDEYKLLDFLGDFVSCITKSQQGNIQEQLQSGARVLDFRICAVNGKLHLHHGIILCEPLESVLEQVLDFLENTSEEFVIIDAGHYDVETLEGGEAKAVQLLSSLSESIFGDRLVKFPDNLASTISTKPIGDITNGQSRVVVAAQTQTGQTTAGSNIWTPKIYAGNYADTTSVDILTEKEKNFVVSNSENPTNQLFQLQWILTPNESFVINEITKAIKTEKSLEAILSYLNANGLKKMASEANAVLGDFLAGYAEANLNNIRSLRLDYIEDTNAVEQCIQLMKPDL